MKPLRLNTNWGQTVTSLLFMFALLGIGYLWLERVVWEMHVYGPSTMMGHYFAKDAYKRGDLRFYELTHDEGDQHFTGRFEDELEVWVWPTSSGLWSKPGQTIDTETVDGYSRAMKNLVSNEDSLYTTSLQGRIHQLRDEETSVRRSAADALSKYGQRAIPAMDTLIVALEDEDVSVRIAVINALAQLGPIAQDALPALQRVADEDDPSIRRLARQAIHALQAEATASMDNP